VSIRGERRSVFVSVRGDLFSRAAKAQALAEALREDVPAAIFLI